LTFHFFESEVGKQLAHTDMAPRFVSGQGETNADVYYELADSCTMGAFAGFRLDESEALEKLGKRIQDATDLAVAFMEAAEKFIVAAVKADGWEKR